MGVTKTEIFTEQQNRIANLAKAFAHPARVAILQLLISRKACVCGDLVDELELAQATVSQHLKELKPDRYYSRRNKPASRLLLHQSPSLGGSAASIW
jgi:DNA-binding transcriptional ArsR family regulator